MLELQANLFFQQAKEQINAHLNSLIPEREDLPYSTLFSAARYSLLSSAKRVRPLLTLATTESYHGNIQHAMIPACAIEMIHTYSLIHDDLPCMDDDDFRRGKPTLHRVYPEGQAVLAGDFLLTFAFETIAASPELSESHKVALIHSLSRYAGAHGMIGGQVIDLESTGKTVDFKTIQWMHRCKTAGLIIAALDCGAIIADAPLDDRQLLQSAGEKIGIAFQIIDDLLDATSCLEEMGKSSGSDAIKQKSTALSSLSLSECQKHSHSLFLEAIDHLTQLTQPTPLLTILFQQLIERKT